MKYLTHVVIVFLMILNVYLFTFCKCKQIKEQFSVSDALKDNSLLRDIYYETFVNENIYRITFDFIN